MCSHVSALFMETTMESRVSKRLQKTCKELHVPAVEAQQAIWSLAPRDWIGKRKAAIAGVARRLGWDFARTWNIAHGRARRIDADEMDRLRAELQQLEEGATKRRETLNELETRLAAFRSDQGSRAADRSGEGAAPAGGRSDGAGEGGMRAGERAAAAVSGR